VKPETMALMEERNFHVDPNTFVQEWEGDDIGISGQANVTGVEWWIWRWCYGGQADMRGYGGQADMRRLWRQGGYGGGYGGQGGYGVVAMAPGRYGGQGGYGVVAMAARAAMRRRLCGQGGYGVAGMAARALWRRPGSYGGGYGGAVMARWVWRGGQVQGQSLFQQWIHRLFLISPARLQPRWRICR